MQKVNKFIARLLILALLAQPATGLTQILSVVGGPAVSRTANGVDLINIVAPNAAGVSKNKYQQLNVGSQGLILNNNSDVTRSGVDTMLAGKISANPLLQLGQSARIILNEVVGPSISSPNGQIEVAGQKAGVVIANPNGITCSGCGFINASRATLTTGTPEFNAQGGLAGFNVGQGLIRIDGQGMLADRTEQVGLLARSIEINAALYAGKQLNMIAGVNRVDWEDQSVNLGAAVVGSSSQFQIDVSRLGGVYAGVIRLVGTEKGLGVNWQGLAIAKAGNFALDSQGNVIINGGIQSVAAVDVKAAKNIEIGQSATLVAGLDVTPSAQLQLTAGEALSNAGALVSAGTTQLKGQQIQINGGAIDSQGAVTIEAQQSAAIQAAQLRSSQSLAVDAGTTLSVGDKAVLAAGLDADGTIVTPSAQLQLTAGAALSNAGALVSAGTTQLKGQQIQINGGAIDSQGAVTIQAQQSAAIQAAQLRSSQSLAVDAGTTLSVGDKAVLAAGLDADGTIVTPSAQLQLTAGAALSNAGALVSAGTTQLKGQQIQINGGAIDSQGAVTIQAQQSAAIQAAQLRSSQSLAVDAGTTLSVGDKAVLAAGLDADGTIVTPSAQLQLTAGAALSNAGALVSAGTTQLKGQQIQINGGAIDGGGDLTVTARDAINVTGSVVRAQGNVALTAGTTLAIGADALVGAGVNAQAMAVVGGGGLQVSATETVTVAGGLYGNHSAAVAAKRVDLTGAAVHSLGNISVQSSMADATLNLSEAQLQAGGDAIIHSAGGINAKATTIQAGAGLALNAKGNIDHRDAVSVGGTGLTLNAASLDNRGGQVRTESVDAHQTGAITITTSSGGIDNRDSGLISASGHLAMGADRQAVSNYHGMLKAQAITLTADTLNNKEGQVVGTAKGEDSSVSVNNLTNFTGTNENGMPLGGLISSKGNLTIRVNNAFTNEGFISGDSVNLESKTGSLTNNANLTAATDLNLKAATSSGIVNNGMIASSGAVELAANSINNGATMMAAGDILLTTSSGFSNASGGVVLSGGGAVKVLADQSIQNDGVLYAQTNLSLVMRSKSRSSSITNSKEAKILSADVVNLGWDCLQSGTSCDAVTREGSVALNNSGAIHSSNGINILVDTLVNGASSQVGYSSDGVKQNLQVVQTNYWAEQREARKEKHYTKEVTWQLVYQPTETLPTLRPEIVAQGNLTISVQQGSNIGGILEGNNVILTGLNRNAGASFVNQALYTQKTENWKATGTEVWRCPWSDTQCVTGIGSPALDRIEDFSSALMSTTNSGINDTGGIIHAKNVVQITDFSSFINLGEQANSQSIASSQVKLPSTSANTQDIMSFTLKGGWTPASSVGEPVQAPKLDGVALASSPVRISSVPMTAASSQNASAPALAVPGRLQKAQRSGLPMPTMPVVVKREVSGVILNDEISTDAVLREILRAQQITNATYGIKDPQTSFDLVSDGEGGYVLVAKSTGSELREAAGASVSGSVVVMKNMGTVRNEAGSIAGDEGVLIEAKDNIENISGQITSSAGAVQLRSLNGSVVSKTAVTRYGTADNYQDVVGQKAVISGKTGVVIDAAKEFQNLGADIQSETGSVKIYASSVDIRSLALQTKSTEVSRAGDGFMYVNDQWSSQTSESALTSSLKTGSNLIVKARSGNVDLLGVDIEAANASITSDAGSVKVTSLALNSSYSEQSKRVGFLSYADASESGQSTTNVLSNIKVKGTLHVKAKDDVTFQGVDALANNVAIDAGQDFNSLAVYDTNSTSSNSASASIAGWQITEDRTRTSTAVGNMLVANTESGIVQIKTGRNVTFEGGMYAGAYVDVDAVGDVTIKAAKNDYESYSKSSGMQWLVGANVGIAGSSASAKAGSMSGASTKLNKNGEVTTNLNKAKQPTRNRLADPNDSDLASASFGIEIWHKEDSTETTAYDNAYFMSTKGTRIHAGKVLDFGGGDFDSGGYAALLGDEIKTTKYEDVTKTKSFSSSTFVGFKAAGNSSIASVVNRGKEMVDQTQGKSSGEGGEAQSTPIDDDVSRKNLKARLQIYANSGNEVAAGAQAVYEEFNPQPKAAADGADRANGGDNPTVNGGLGSLEAVGMASNLVMAETGSGSVSATIKNVTESSSTKTTSENTNRINARSVTIYARKNVDLAGVDILADDIGLLSDEGSVSVRAAKSTKIDYSYDTTNELSAGLTGSANAFQASAGVGASFSISSQTNREWTDETTYQNSVINASGTLTIKSKGDTNFAGVVAKGKTVNLDIQGDLNITSLQDEVNNRTENGGFSLSLGASVNSKTIVAPTFNASARAGAGWDKSKKVAEQSSLVATETMTGNIRGNVRLTGSQLSAAHEASTLTVGGALIATELSDFHDKDGHTAGGGIGLSESASVSGSVEYNRDERIAYKATQKVTVSGIKVNAAGGVIGNINTDVNNTKTVTQNEHEIATQFSMDIDPSAFKKDDDDADAKPANKTLTKRIANNDNDVKVTPRLTRKLNDADQSVAVNRAVGRLSDKNDGILRLVGHDSDLDVDAVVNTVMDVGPDIKGIDLVACNSGACARQVQRKLAEQGVNVPVTGYDGAIKVNKNDDVVTASEYSKYALGRGKKIKPAGDSSAIEKRYAKSTFPMFEGEIYSSKSLTPDDHSNLLGLNTQQKLAEQGTNKLVTSYDVQNEVNKNSNTVTAEGNSEYARTTRAEFQLALKGLRDKVEPINEEGNSEYAQTTRAEFQLALKGLRDKVEPINEEFETDNILALNKSLAGHIQAKDQSNLNFWHEVVGGTIETRLKDVNDKIIKITEKTSQPSVEAGSPDLDRVILGKRVNKVLASGFTDIASSAKTSITLNNLREVGLNVAGTLFGWIGPVDEAIKNKIKENSENSKNLLQIQELAEYGRDLHNSGYQTAKFLQKSLEFESLMPRSLKSRLGSAPTVNSIMVDKQSFSAGLGVRASVLNEPVKKVDASGQETVSNSSTVKVGGGSGGVTLNISGGLTGGAEFSTSISRANDGNISVAMPTAYSIGVTGGATARVAANIPYSDDRIPSFLPSAPNFKANATLGGAVTFKGGSVSLTNSPETTFAVQYSSALNDGKTIFNNISESGMKSGFKLEKQFSQKLRDMGVNDDILSGVYGKEGDVIASFAPGKIKERIDAGQHLMPALLPVPLWTSKEYSSIGVAGSLSGEISGDLFGFGGGGTLKGSASTETTRRKLISAKNPGDIFSPSSTLSKEKSKQYAAEYFSTTSSAQRKYEIAIADSLGFATVDDYRSKLVQLVKGDKSALPSNEKLSAGLVKLTGDYKSFVDGVNALDAYYNATGIRRESLKESASKAADELKEKFGINLSEITTAKKGSQRSVEYENFITQVTAVSDSYSALAGVIKLTYEDKDVPVVNDFKKEIDGGSLPWTKLDMAVHAQYVREIENNTFKNPSSVTSTFSQEAAAFLTVPSLGAATVKVDADGNENTSGVSLLSGRKVTEFNQFYTKTVTHQPSDSTDPGQTGYTVTSETGVRKLTPDGVYPPAMLKSAKETMHGLLDAALFSYSDFYTDKSVVRERAYPLEFGSYSDKKDRLFTAFTAGSQDSMTSKSFKVDFNVPTPTIVTPYLSLGYQKTRSRGEQTSFSFGNDTGATAIVATKLFADLQLPAEKFKSNPDQFATDFMKKVSGEDPGFSGNAPMLSKLFFGNPRYDHISASLSKFRNTGFVVGEETGVTTSFDGLHDSKGKLRASLQTPSERVNKGGFLAYAKEKYDGSLVATIAKEYMGAENKLPSTGEVDALLSAQHSEGISVQQYLKKATMEQRREYYLNDLGGKKMVEMYLQTLDFTGRVNDAIFQNNTYKIRVDQGIQRRVDELFGGE